MAIKLRPLAKYPSKRHKYNVASVERRRFLGRTFDSLAEKEYAEVLVRLQKEGVVLDFICQPRLWLGVPENVYVPDFLVVPAKGRIYYVDVKGAETRKFLHDMKLWQQYGKFDLVVVKRVGPLHFRVTRVIKGEYGDGGESFGASRP